MAADDKGPWIAPRFASLFACGRPPLPWDIADRINQVLAQHSVTSVGVTGSLSPSVLTAVGYGAPNRKINTFASHSQWDDSIGWGHVIDDSPGMEKDHPWPEPYLPVDPKFWEGASPFFGAEAMFADLPFSHRAVGLKLSNMEIRQEPRKVILLGFLERHDGPVDLLDWALSNGYRQEEFNDIVRNREKDEVYGYRLVVAMPPAEAKIM